MLTTRFTELVGCAVPIQQAGMGALATRAWPRPSQMPAGWGWYRWEASLLL
jgi:hypothetical protein